MSISNEDIMKELKTIKDDVDDLKKVVNMGIGAYRVLLVFGKLTAGAAFVYAVARAFYLSVIGG